MRYYSNCINILDLITFNFTAYNMDLQIYFPKMPHSISGFMAENLVCPSTFYHLGLILMYSMQLTQSLFVLTAYCNPGVYTFNYG